MRNLNRVAVIAVFALLAGTIASAQMGGMRGGGPPQMHGVWNPVVGQGAQYEMQPKSGDKMTMEIAIVGKEAVNGKDAYWFETTMNSPRMGGEMVMKSLTVQDGPNTQTTRTIMQMPGQPPMEMPAQMMQRNASPQPSDIRSGAQDMGSESITVPAGTFTCEHYRMKDGGDAWVAVKVGPYGLVKFQGSDTTMVLTKVISNAQDKITGTPQKFNPGMMGRPPQQ